MPETRKRRPEFHDTAPRDRYCDLILTGGVTSAIAYPAAVLTLASAYRFNCIGGSSSGAGIAALAAAAEYRRRRGSVEGFRTLLERTSALADDAGGRTKLASLFQPDARTKRLFEVFVSAFEPPTTKEKLTAFIRALLWVYIYAIIAGVFAAFTVVWSVSHSFALQWWLAYLPVSLVFALACLGDEVYRDAVNGLVRNNFGLCNGGPLACRGVKDPPLVKWLHELIQEIAGRSDGDPPLTFGDLWKAPGSPRETLGERAPPGARSIELQMFTANATHGRPYLLPELDSSSRLFFCRQELESYFPEKVIEHLVAHSRPYAPAEGGDPPATEATAGFLELPGEHLPIVVAARLSLSFPVLFSAVPLWAIDYERTRGERKLARCWFSDGGVCSNFPIHLFDQPVPAWPTFGISLSEASPFWKAKHERVWLPADHRQGRADRWRRFDDENGISRLFGFLGALAMTAKDWNDATLARMPGVRDRVVRIGLTAGEGGLNLRMPKPGIERLAGYGAEAAKRLLERFAKPSTASGQAQGWNEHRWVRFSVLLHTLRKNLVGLTAVASLDRYAQPLADQVSAAADAAPLQGDEDSKLDRAQAAALGGLLAALEHAERAFATQAIEQPYRALPEPALRIRPPL